MASGPRVSLDITEKRFPGATVPVHEALSLDIAPSSVTALLGPSGVGKSTLLRLLAGIDGDFVGSITIDGVMATAAPPPGFVFQDARLLPWLTAADNIRAAAAHLRPNEAIAALARVGLADAAALYPHQLSGGMQRRVALARAVSVNARLLLLDEPFVSLDRELVADMHQLFAEVIADVGATVIVVSHLADDAARLADRVILLQGRPARVVADIDLPVPRAERDPATLTNYRARLDSAADTRR